MLYSNRIAAQVVVLMPTRDASYFRQIKANVGVAVLVGNMPVIVGWRSGRETVHVRQ